MWSSTCDTWMSMKYYEYYPDIIHRHGVTMSHSYSSNHFSIHHGLQPGYKSCLTERWEQRHNTWTIFAWKCVPHKHDQLWSMEMSIIQDFLFYTLRTIGSLAAIGKPSVCSLGSCFFMEVQPLNTTTGGGGHRLAFTWSRAPAGAEWNNEPLWWWTEISGRGRAGKSCYQRTP